MKVVEITRYLKYLRDTVYEKIMMKIDGSKILFYHAIPWVDTINKYKLTINLMAVE